MSTDSTELTFVRCPACRSLVPAVSTRCRMCGATLDASAKVDQSEEERKRTSRVRQRTMSQPQSELSDTAGQIRQEMAPPEPETEAATADSDPFDIFGEAESVQQSPDTDLNDDPLGQYIADADDEEGQPEEAAKEEDPLFAEPAEEDSFAAPAPEPVVEAPPVEAPAPRAARPEPQPPVQESKPAPDANRPRVTVESGSRPSGKPSGLSFGKGRDEKRAERAEDSGERRHKNEARGESRHENRGEGREGRQENRQERRGNENDRFARQSRPENDQNKHNKQEKPAMLNKPVPQQNESRKAIQAQNGRLFGWLVSYENPMGTAIELREGRFFVSGTPLKDNDLVIADKGLSTPHAMVSISSGGFKIQDLMSESGVHVRRRNQGAFQSEEGTMTIGHGDVLKLGDAEYIVATIDLPK